MNDQKPPIVFLCPVIPSFTGNGLAMRAARNLQALAGDFTVHLLVVAMYGGQEGTPDADLLEYCAGWKRILAPVNSAMRHGWSWRNLLRWGAGRLPVEWNGWNADNNREAVSYFAATNCVRLWVFRFYLLPWARDWLDGGGKAWLDIDELESKAHRSRAELTLQAGEPGQAAMLREEAEKYRALEAEHLRRFEQIFAASALEAVHIGATAGPLTVETWPNVVAPPAENQSLVSRPEDRTWRLLFIGSIGYFPNREAVRFAAREILPRLQSLIPVRVVLTVAGAGADVHRNSFEDLPDLDWLGTVPDVTPVYARAHMVLVPLRAGGGTRIKILEAFAHCIPVVSTRIGAEGLDVVHDRELLLADGPAEIAEACRDLYLDPVKRRRLVAAARDYVTTRHAPANLSLLAESLRRRLGNPRAG